jgi:hypothetical protein
MIYGFVNHVFTLHLNIDHQITTLYDIAFDTCTVFTTYTTAVRIVDASRK